MPPRSIDDASFVDVLAVDFDRDALGGPRPAGTAAARAHAADVLVIAREHRRWLRGSPDAVDAF